MKFMRRAGLIATILMFTVRSAASATSITVTVPATSDPWLAGMPDGSTASGNDRAPAQSPVFVSGLPLAPGVALAFAPVGAVGNYSPIPITYPPEGNLLHIPPHGAGPENGIASAHLPMNCLLGVFLGEEQPNQTAPPPSLDFTTQAARDYLSLRPALKQVFFIGDGRTGDGRIQEVVPPVGATRLFLGTMDEWTWTDNIGAFSVTVIATDARISDVFDAAADFSPFQGGSPGTWLYQEFDGQTFSDLIFQPFGNSFSESKPAWSGQTSRLPILFWDSNTPEGLVFHPGTEGGGPQPSRHDVVLSWVAPTNGFYSIRGFVRGDLRFGIGGNGFEFEATKEDERLYNLAIEFDDKSTHAIFLQHLYVRVGNRISFRVYDRGNNEHDVGVFNFVIKPEDMVPRIRVSQVELCWNAEPNVTYQVEYRSTLTTNMWLPFDTNCYLGDGSVKCVYDTVPNDQPQRFYRITTNCIVHR